MFFLIFIILLTNPVSSESSDITKKLSSLEGKKEKSSNFETRRKVKYKRFNETDDHYPSPEEQDQIFMEVNKIVKKRIARIVRKHNLIANF